MTGAAIDWHAPDTTKGDTMPAQQQTEKKKQPNPTRLLVCAGGVALTGDRPGVAFVPATPVGDGWIVDGDEIYLGAKRGTRHCRAGHVYEVEFDRENPSTIYVDTWQFLGVLSDEEQRAKFVARDEIEQGRRRLKREQQKANRDDAIAALLSPLRAEYRKTDALGRRLLEARVLHALRSTQDFGG